MLDSFLNPQSRWPFGLDQGRLIVFLATVLLIFVALAFLDSPITQLVAQMPDEVRAPFYVITRAGNSDWNLIPTLLVAILAVLAGRFWLTGLPAEKARTIAAVSGFAFAAIAGPGLVANIIKRLVGRARPVFFEEAGVFSFDPVVNNWTFQSFPSGDTTTIFAFAMMITFFFPRAIWWAMAGAALVGLSRIMVGVHYPTDVFGGVIAGILGAYSVRNYFLSRNWVFGLNPEGKITPNLNWPQPR